MPLKNMHFTKIPSSIGRFLLTIWLWWQTQHFILIFLLWTSKRREKKTWRMIAKIENERREITDVRKKKRIDIIMLFHISNTSFYHKWKSVGVRVDLKRFVFYFLSFNRKNVVKYDANWCLLSPYTPCVHEKNLDSFFIRLFPYIRMLLHAESYWVLEIHESSIEKCWFVLSLQMKPLKWDMFSFSLLFHCSFPFSYLFFSTKMNPKCLVICGKHIVERASFFVSIHWTENKIISRVKRNVP